MPIELQRLKEQLLNLKVIYESAVFSDMPLKDIQMIRKLMKEVEKSIERQEKIIRGQKS